MGGKNRLIPAILSLILMAVLVTNASSTTAVIRIDYANGKTAPQSERTSVYAETIDGCVVRSPDLKRLKKLTALWYGCGKNEDFSFLGSMKSLYYLKLSDLPDMEYPYGYFSGLPQMPSVGSLDISELTAPLPLNMGELFPNVQFLSLRENQINNCTGMESVTTIYLYAPDNAVGIDSFPSVKELYIDGLISDCTEIVKCEGLESLTLRAKSASSLSPLYSIKSLKTLTLEIPDISSEEKDTLTQKFNEQGVTVLIH